MEFCHCTEGLGTVNLGCADHNRELPRIQPPQMWVGRLALRQRQISCYSSHFKTPNENVLIKVILKCIQDTEGLTLDLGTIKMGKVKRVDQ